MTTYKFMGAKDQEGLPMEHPAYIKKNCKMCYGRGHQSFLVGDGYHEKTREPNPERVLKACVCVNRGYVRARLEVQRRKRKLATPPAI